MENYFLQNCINKLLFSFSDSQPVRIVEQNHQDVITQVGNQVNLICAAESPAKVCSFRAPTGESYTILEGARQEIVNQSKYLQPLLPSSKVMDGQPLKHVYD